MFFHNHTYMSTYMHAHHKKCWFHISGQKHAWTSLRKFIFYQSIVSPCASSTKHLRKWHSSVNSFDALSSYQFTCKHTNGNKLLQQKERAENNAHLSSSWGNCPWIKYVCFAFFTSMLWGLQLRFWLVCISHPISWKGPHIRKNPENTHLGNW